jgi:hypothetical protein
MHPDDVRLLVAHEPMIADVLPDREQVLAVSRDIYDTYHKSGFGPAMAKFLALAGQKGEIPEDYLEQPAPDPALFGLPTDDDGSRDDPLLGQNMISSTHFSLTSRLFVPHPPGSSSRWGKNPRASCPTVAGSASPDVLAPR